MARKTLADYEAAVTHALGNEPSTGFTSTQIVNDALRYLCARHSWRWRRGGPVFLSLVADQPYVELPQDFGEIESLTYPGTSVRSMSPTTMDTIQKLRAVNVVRPAFHFYYAVNSGSLDDDFREEGLTVNLLELYPTPTTSISDALVLSYLRNVDDLADPTDVPQIPSWMDYALTLSVRHIAHTLEDDDANSASKIALDLMFHELLSRDAMTQHRMGVMRGGLYPRDDALSPLYPDNIGDPTA